MPDGSSLPNGAATSTYPAADTSTGLSTSSSTATPTSAAALAGTAVSNRKTISLSETHLPGAAVPPCAAGSAHPNICCKGAPYQATICTQDATHPFDICDTGQYAYPDPNLCCSLDDKTACTQPDGVDAGVGASQRGSCQSPCTPGAYPTSMLSTLPSGASLDGWLCCFGTGLSCALKQPICTGLCTGATEQHWCDRACPAGWAAPMDGQVDACCQADADGKNFCFSQSDYIGSSSGSGAAFSDASSCIGEIFSEDGNSYVVTCDFGGTPSCKCLINGVVARALLPDDMSRPRAGSGIGDCENFAACGFPQ